METLWSLDTSLDTKQLRVGVHRPTNKRLNVSELSNNDRRESIMRGSLTAPKTKVMSSILVGD